MPFKEMLAEVPDVSSNLTPQQIEAMLDPTEYTGVCNLFAQREASRDRDMAATLD